MRIIGKNLEATRETSVVASGTIESGISVVVNSNGTVSAVSESSVSEVVGTPVIFEDANTQDIGATFDSTNNKVVLAYVDRGNSDYGTAVVGTVSGTSITFGTPVVFDNGGIASYIEAGFDENAGKVVIVYRDGGNLQYGTSIVGTVSGTSISFGTKVVFNSAESQGQGITYDSSAQKMVVTYRDEGNSNYGTARVGTVSGTSISYGSETVFQSQSVQDTNPTYDANAGKIVVAYRNATQTNDGYAAVGTVSGTSISFGTPVVWSTGANATSNIGITYDSNAQKVVICYKDANNSDYGRAIVGTVSGTSISFGSPVNFLAGRAEFQKIVYDTAAQKIVIVYEDTTNLQYGTVISGTVSGTSITFDTASVFESAEVEYTIATYDSNAEKVVIAYRDSANLSKGTSVVYQPAYTSRNLTAENFIGMARGITDAASASLGSITTFSAGNSPREAAVFDSNSNKVVIAYRDGTNSSYATVVVATVSGETISFGTPVVYNSGSVADVGLAFDTSSNQVFINFYDTTNSNAGTGILGSVSGTSITFGSKAVYLSTLAQQNKAVYDSTNDRVVAVYKKGSNAYGEAVVGSVSGTSITWGTPVTFNAATTDEIAATFDSSNGKVVIVYQDTGGNSGYGTTIIGTVSGTSISFGTPVVHNASNSPDNAVTFDSINNKVVVGYELTGTGTYAKVGTVSGTTISYGSAVNFGNSTDWRYVSAVFDVNAESVVFAYGDPSNSNNGKIISGSVSGSTITFEPEQTFLSATLNYTGAAYDSLNKKVVVAFQDRTDNYGKAIVSTTAYVNRETVATDGNALIIDTQGAINTAQGGLTAGNRYYVQNDGTLSTTAGDPSVSVGIAVSSTKLLVKG